MFPSLKRLFGVEARSSLASPSPELLALFGAMPTAAGISLSGEMALSSPTALAAMRAIAESVGTLPFHLFHRADDGSRDRDHAHPVAALLAGDWCPWAGGVETRTALQLDALLHGAGYALVVRAGDRPVELHRLEPTSVTRDTSGPEPVFRVRTDGAERVHGWRDVLYLPTPGSTDNRLVNLVHLAREAIALDLVMGRHQANLFANGARPAGVFKYGKTLSSEIVERLRASLRGHAGENSGKTMILEDGMDFVPLQFSSVDLQFLELRRFVIEEIARAFKVPGTLIGDLDRATWRNVEELMRQFVQTCLMPWAEIWQSGLERVLLTQDERNSHFIEAKFDDLLRGDLTARFTAYRQATGGAWMSRNEARRLDNLPPIKGGDELILQAGQGDSSANPKGDAANGL